MSDHRVLLLDHYGWSVDTAGERARRALTSRGDVSVVELGLDGALHRVEGEEEADSDLVLRQWTVDLSELGLHPTCTRADALTVVRVSTPTVWEALATCVLRQVVRATTARARFERLVAAASDGVAFPSPEQVLQCGERQMTALGLRFSWPKLRALAEWAVSAGADQTADAPRQEQLLAEAAALRGFGPWSLAVARWDCGGDATCYPVGDYVVQAGAARLYPAMCWPRRPDAFEAAWREHAAERVEDLTVLALCAADEATWARATARPSVLA